MTMIYIFFVIFAIFRQLSMARSEQHVVQSGVQLKIKKTGNKIISSNAMSVIFSFVIFKTQKKILYIFKFTGFHNGGIYSSGTNSSNFLTYNQQTCKQPKCEHSYLSLITRPYYMTYYRLVLSTKSTGNQKQTILSI